MNDFPRPAGDHDPEDDERIRRLLDDAVSDVEPRDALGAIHTRTEVSSMQRTRSWFLGAAAAVAAVAATVVAVTVLSGDGTTGGRDPGFAAPSTSSSPEPGPTPGPSPDETTSASPDDGASPSENGTVAPETRTVPVYYVGDTSRGPRLYREFHRVESSGADAVTLAVHQAVSVAPDDPDYRTPWPAGTTAQVVESPGTPDVITVDITSAGSPRTRPAGMSEEEARMAVEQVIYTAQAAAQARHPVQLLLDGERTDQVLGVPASEPLAQGDAVDVLAQVWVIDPPEGAELTAPFEVSGLAAAFEANVVWELREGDTVVKSGFTTAEECCTMAPYSFTVNAPPGEYTLVVQDTDPSGGEGFGPWTDTKRVTVVP